MKLKLKEDPKEWRKITLLSALPLAVIATLLCWRHNVSKSLWTVAICLLGIVALSAVLRPGLFRGYYRVSSRVGFFISQSIGRLLLLILFFLVLTPLGWLLRVAGKDLLRLKPRRSSESLWNPSKGTSPLDRLF